MLRPQGVTPFVGVWIETESPCIFAEQSQVTPFVGVWIETYFVAHPTVGDRCHTLRGCVD